MKNPGAPQPLGRGQKDFIGFFALLHLMQGECTLDGEFVFLGMRDRAPLGKFFRLSPGMHVEQDPNPGKQDIGIILFGCRDGFEFFERFGSHVQIQITIRSMQPALGFKGMSAVTISQVKHFRNADG